MASVQHHERIVRDEVVATGSDRGFGLLMAAVAAVVAGWSLLDGGRWWPVPTVLGILLVAVALAAPGRLATANRGWAAFGRLLHRLVSPAVMTLVFVVSVVPTAAVARLLRRDLLRLRLDPEADSYWIPREHPVTADSFEQQF